MGHDHRSGLPGGDGRDQGVQSADLGVAEPGALFGVAVDFDDGVVDVDHRQLLDSGDDGRVLGQGGQEPGGDCVELTHVPEREGAQERAQRRGCVAAGEDPTHPAVTQQGHVLEGVGAGDHARDQRVHLRSGVGALVRGHAQMLIGQGGKTCPLCQSQDRDQAGRADQVRVIEDR